MRQDAVHVTGMGMVTAIGVGVEANLASLLAERTGIGPITRLVTRHRGKIPAAEVRMGDMELSAIAAPADTRGWTRAALLGLAAVREATLQAGLDPRGPRIGLISATTAGGIDKSEGIYDRFFDNAPSDEVLEYIGTHDPGEHAERIAHELGMSSVVTTVSTACSSSANAIGFAARLIRAGLLDAAIAGGTDALNKFTLNGFNSLMILDPQACRPFDGTRAGLNLGEAGAYIVLESATHARRRGAAPLAVVNGFANTNEAYHATASSPDGEGARKAMDRALASAGLRPQDISHVNTHGTGTLNNDASEGLAMHRLFEGKVPPFTSTKSFTGHTLGAAGAVEAIYAVLAIRAGAHFATLRHGSVLAEAPVVPVLRSSSGHAITHVLSNSFGFGGNNTSLILSAP